MGSPSTPAPPINTPGKDLIKYTKGLEQALPSIFGLESSYRSRFGDLNIADQKQSLAALLGMGSGAVGASQDQIGQARDSEFADMRGNTGSVMDILRGVSPQSAAALDSQSQMAQSAYDRANGPLSFQEKRGTDQAVRESFAARGRINDNASIFDEMMGRESVMAAKRAEASALGGQAFGMGQQFSSPALQLLGQTPNSVLLGQDYLNMGRSAVGANTPQLVDTGAGLSLGQQGAANMANWSSSVAAAKNSQQAANTSAISSAAGSIIGILAGLSDKRAKKDIKRVGKTDKGLPIYTYKYKGSDTTVMGVMAQEVKKKQPKALGPTLGDLLTVNYAEVN